jgi:hypothetical protein
MVTVFCLLILDPGVSESRTGETYVVCWFDLALAMSFDIWIFGAGQQELQSPRLSSFHHSPIS